MSDFFFFFEVLFLVLSFCFSDEKKKLRIAQIELENARRAWFRVSVV